LSFDYARYPFTKVAIQHLGVVDPGLEAVAGDPAYARAMNRAVERVSQAILYSQVSEDVADPEAEFLSFPTAGIMVALIGDNFLSRRFALSEAVRANTLLSVEPDSRVMEFASTEYGWDAKKINEDMDGEHHAYDLYFADYLKASHGLKEEKWKMVNRYVNNGYVRLKKSEFTRLLQNAVEQGLMELLQPMRGVKAPPQMRERIESLKALLDEHRPKNSGGSLPSKMIEDALPPCIASCLSGLLAGRKLGHMERFALTSYLVAANMSVDEIVTLYSQVSDFNESFTRYQVEHIAGTRRGEPYTPPMCKTLLSHSICRREVDKRGFCGRISHPLQYYRMATFQPSPPPKPNNTV
jgi:DNA primase large subunit